jgi:hypothetical protein
MRSREWDWRRRKDKMIAVRMGIRRGGRICLLVQVHFTELEEEMDGTEQFSQTPLPQDHITRDESFPVFLGEHGEFVADPIHLSGPRYERDTQ